MRQKVRQRRRRAGGVAAFLVFAIAGPIFGDDCGTPETVENVYASIKMVKVNGVSTSLQTLPDWYLAKLICLRKAKNIPAQVGPNVDVIVMADCDGDPTFTHAFGTP